MSKPFILNEESRVNNHGFVVLNSGGKFERFKENPVMLFAHDQGELIGRWENLRVEGANLIADPVFDEADEASKKVQGKVDRGFLKGASMGITIETAELRDIPGTGLIPVVTSWELMEASLAAVPSNAQCLRLYSPDGAILSLADEIKLSINNLINKNQQPMDKIILTAESATVLKVSKETDITALNAAIMELSALKDKAEKELSDYRAAQAKALVEGAIKEGKLTAEKRESFEKLAISDFDQAKDLIDTLPPRQTFSDKLKAAKPAGVEREGWDYLKWAKEDAAGLAKMERENPTGFAELKASYKSKR